MIENRYLQAKKTVTLFEVVSAYLQEKLAINIGSEKLIAKNFPEQLTPCVETTSLSNRDIPTLKKDYAQQCLRKNWERKQTEISGTITTSNFDLEQIAKKDQTPVLIGSSILTPEQPVYGYIGLRADSYDTSSYHFTLYKTPAEAAQATSNSLKKYLQPTLAASPQFDPELGKSLTALTDIYSPDIISFEQKIRNCFRAQPATMDLENLTCQNFVARLSQAKSVLDQKTSTVFSSFQQLLHSLTQFDLVFQKWQKFKHIPVVETQLSVSKKEIKKAVGRINEESAPDPDLILAQIKIIEQIIFQLTNLETVLVEIKTQKIAIGEKYDSLNERQNQIFTDSIPDKLKHKLEIIRSEYERFRENNDLSLSETQAWLERYEATIIVAEQWPDQVAKIAVLYHHYDNYYEEQALSFTETEKEQFLSYLSDLATAQTPPDYDGYERVPQLQSVLETLCQTIATRRKESEEQKIKSSVFYTLLNPKREPEPLPAPKPKETKSPAPAQPKELSHQEQEEKEKIKLIKKLEQLPISMKEKTTEITRLEQEKNELIEQCKKFKKGSKDRDKNENKINVWEDKIIRKKQELKSLEENYKKIVEEATIKELDPIQLAINRLILENTDAYLALLRIGYRDQVSALLTATIEKNPQQEELLMKYWMEAELQ
jgi:hypothetical protein